MRLPSTSAYAGLLRKLAFILLLSEAAALIKTVPQALSGRGDFPSFYRAAVMLSGGARRDLYSIGAQDRFESLRLLRKSMRADVPAFLEALVDNGALDALDTDGLFNDSKNTCTLARGGAHPSSEFGEVCTRIGFGQGWHRQERNWKTSSLFVSRRRCSASCHCPLL